MDVVTSGAIPTLESALSYAFRRHEVILNNIANSSTPGYRAQDLPVADFQAALDRAGHRGRPTATVLGGLAPAGRHDGAAMLNLLSPVPQPGAPGPDGNTVVPELEAAKLAKNAGMFSALSQLLTRQYDLLEKALRERI